MLNCLSRSSMTALGSTLQNRAILSLSSAGNRVLGPTDQDVRLDADLAECADGVLRRLGLQLGRRLQVGDQRQVDVHAVFPADVEGELADRLQERQALDVADGSADLGDHDVDVVGGQAVDGRLDLVGHVGDDLNGLPLVESALRAPSGSPRDRSCRSCSCSRG